MVSLFVLSCATENKQEDVVRELAKKDAIEKLQLPEGTKFSDENIEVTEAKTESGTLGVTYLVKITINFFGIVLFLQFRPENNQSQRKKC